jgi:cysteine desulfurase
LLVVRRGTRWRNPLPADEGESGHWAGAPNVPAIVGAVAALRSGRTEREDTAERLRALTDRIRTAVPALVPDAVVLGDAADRLPHLVTFSVLYVDGMTLLTELDRQGFAVSSGSSCTSDTLTPSHVLQAMGAFTGGNIRISLHPAVTAADVDRFLAVLPGLIAEARAQAPGNQPIRPVIGQPAEPAGRSPARRIDSRGRRCPQPVLDLARALPLIPVGGELLVLADDPAAAGDIAAWCRMRGQELVSSEEQPDGSGQYLVRRLH